MSRSFKYISSALILIIFNAIFPGVLSTEDSYAGCVNTDYKTVTCVNTFNLTAFLRHNSNLTYTNLRIFNTTLKSISTETGFLFEEPSLFEAILIKNAPNLSYVDPVTIGVLKDHLRDFRAIATALPDYNEYQDKIVNPFGDFVKLHEIYIGPTESSCPDPSILYPCTCEHGWLYRTLVTGLYGSSTGSTDTIDNTTVLNCRNDTLTGLSLRSIFRKYAASAQNSHKHFDVVHISGNNIRFLPKDVFVGVSITSLYIADAPNFGAIDSKAFTGSRSIQVFQVNKGNFTGASNKQVKHVFRALSSLVNVRNLRLWSLGLPFIPSGAIVPKNGEIMHNLRYLSLDFDRREHKTGIRTVGSRAFSGAPKLMEIGLTKNFIQKFDPFVFAFNQTRNNLLTVHIGVNPFNDSGLAPNAFSGSRGPIQIKFEIDSFAASDPANNPAFNRIPESVFRPFLEENQENSLRIDYFNVEIWCDGNSKWMFDANGILKKRVQDGIQITRVNDNTVGSTPDSFRCKAKSNFESLPRCLVFPAASLIHCGGKSFDVRAEFKKLESLNLTANVSKLIFSASEIEELPGNSFGQFEFSEINFSGARALRLIHPNAFGNSAKSLREFAANGTSLVEYPNFASFPNLVVSKLDDTTQFSLTNNTFNYSSSDAVTEKSLTLYFDNGKIETSAFDLARNVSFRLVVGARRDCDTMRCIYDCTPTNFIFQENVFRLFLESNPNNRIQTTCYLECNCQVKWLYNNWKIFEKQFHIWNGNDGSDFYCLSPGTSIKSNDSFFGFDPSKLNQGEYFTDHC